MENIRLRRPKSFLRKLNNTITPYGKTLKKVILLVTFCYALIGYSQNNPDDIILIPEIKNLIKEGKNKEAIVILRKRLDRFSDQISDKNVAADSLIKHYNYYLQHELNTEKRTTYHEKLIELNQNAVQLDTLKLIRSYLLYTVELTNNSNNNSKALVVVDAAIENWETYYDKPKAIYAKLNSLRGAILLNLKLEGESFEQYEKTVRIYESIEKKNPLDLWELYNGLSKSYDRYGFYDKALYCSSKAEAIMRSDEAKQKLKQITKRDGQEHQYLISDLSTKIRIYKNLDNEDGVLTTLQEVEKYIAGKLLNPMSKYQTSGSYNYTGLYYLNDKREYQKAISYFNKALQIVPQEYFKSHVDYYKLNILKAQAGLDSSLRTIASLESYLKERPNLSKQLAGFAYQSSALLKLKNNLQQDALKDAQLAINAFSKSKTPLNIFSDSVVANYDPTTKIKDVFYIVGMADAIQSIENKTDSTIIVANNLYKIALKQFKACYSRNFYSSKLETIYNKIIKGLLASNPFDSEKNLITNDVLNTIVNDKSNFLWHNFLVNRQNDRLKIPDSLNRKEKSLRKKLLAYQTKEFQNSYSSEEYSSIIVEIKSELESLSKAIKDDYVTYNFFDSNSFDLKEFRDKLDPEEAVLYYQNLDNSLFCFVITKPSVSFFSLPDFSSLEDRIMQFAKDAGNLSSPIDDLKKKGTNLYLTLNLDQVKDYNKITIVPDKILNYLPFELLTENGNYLIENKIISYTTALPLLNYDLNTEKSTNNNSLLFASAYNNIVEEAPQLAVRNGEYNLKGAISETKLLKEITKGKLFSGEKASKSNFISNAKNSNVLHFAMHAFINNENSELSYLAFSDDKKDNKMYISELYGLNLNANLAVLSACNTGIGNIKSGEGMVSLNRAFTYAGIPTTISSLWSVPDKTTKSIIVDFYENLDQGLISSQALREAKLNFLNSVTDKELKHPYYWAGFVQHGRDVTINFDSLLSDSKWLFGFLALISIYYFYFKRKQRLNN